ncbi:hypothetical protein ACA910_016661 [Epithemia clementina (nom. ined.)]
MAVLLETSVGDLVIDLDLEGSPILCRNFLKLCKARYYTQSLIHHVVPNRFVVMGDPTGTGQGGTSFFGLLSQVSNNNNNNNSSNNNDDSLSSMTTTTTRLTTTTSEEKLQNRFLASSSGRRLTDAECREKGRVVAVELFGMKDTVGSQFLITTTNGPDRALDGYASSSSLFFSSSSSNEMDPSKQASGFLSLGKVVEDDNHILDRLADCYADNEGRPYADWRIKRALVVHDPFEDPRAIQKLFQKRGVVVQVDDETGTETVVRSPSPIRPPEETVIPRIPVEEVDSNPVNEDGADLSLQEQKFRQEMQQKEDRSRAVVLEILGDLPDADIKTPENVLFICKLNAITTDEDLQLIFSRFDENVQVEIVRDQETGQSLNYAFAEFTTPQQATQAYLKMNQTLIDDRRIIVDFSQSVAKLWDRYRQRYRTAKKPPAPPLSKRPRHF